MAMVQLRQISGRLLKGKEQAPELGRFPGQVVLPRLCFRPTNLQQQGELAGGRRVGAVGAPACSPVPDRGWLACPPIASPAAAKRLGGCNLPPALPCVRDALCTRLTCFVIRPASGLRQPSGWTALTCRGSRSSDRGCGRTTSSCAREAAAGQGLPMSVGCELCREAGELAAGLPSLPDGCSLIRRRHPPLLTLAG